MCWRSAECFWCHKRWVESGLSQRAVQQEKIFAMPEAANEVVEIEVTSRSAVSLNETHVPR